MDTYQYLIIGLALIGHAATISYFLGKLSSKVDNQKESSKAKDETVQIQINRIETSFNKKFDDLQNLVHGCVGNGGCERIRAVENRTNAQHDKLLAIENDVKWLRKVMEKNGHNN